MRRRAEPFDAFSRGVASGTLLALVGFVTTIIHGIRVGFCDAAGGTAIFALGPAGSARSWAARGARSSASCVFSCRRPLVAHRCSPSCWRRSGLFSASCSASGASTARPTIFAFDPFFGFFSGTLYDTVVEATIPLLTYRLGLGAHALAAGIFAAHLVHGEEGQPILRSLHRPGMPLLGAAVRDRRASILVLEARGSAIGRPRRPSSAISARAWPAPAATSSTRASMRAEEARLFARDCDEEVPAIEKLLRGAAAPDASPRISFATPPTRGGSWAQGTRSSPSRGATKSTCRRRAIRTRCSGTSSPTWWPARSRRGRSTSPATGRGSSANPGLIEGVAVAASPDEDALTPAEWSRAMLDLKHSSAARAALLLRFSRRERVEIVHGGRRVRALRQGEVRHRGRRAWYGGAKLPELTKSSWGVSRPLGAPSSRKIKLPEAALAIARARFDRPAVWGRKCPHTVDLFRKEAERAQERGDYIQARAHLRRALHLDPHDDNARLALAGCLLRTRRKRRSDQDPRRDRSATRARRASSRTARSRSSPISISKSGDYDRAAQRYGQLAARSLDEDSLRTIEVKTGSLGDPRARDAIAAYLVGAPERGVDAMTAGALLGQWIAEDPTDGLPEYLLGKDLVNRGLYADAAENVSIARSPSGFRPGACCARRCASG